MEQTTHQTIWRTIAIILHAIANFFILSLFIDYDITGGWLLFILFVLVCVVLIIVFVLHTISFVKFIQSK